MLYLGALLLLCYLIGLTYVAKQETLGEVRNLWPLLFLAAPVIYGFKIAPGSSSGALSLLLFVAWTGVALWFLKRRGPGDVPRAVISLIAGISLLDAVLIAGAGAYGVAWLAVGGFPDPRPAALGRRGPERALSRRAAAPMNSWP